MLSFFKNSKIFKKIPGKLVEQTNIQYLYHIITTSDVLLGLEVLLGKIAFLSSLFNIISLPNTFIFWKRTTRNISHIIILIFQGKLKRSQQKNHSDKKKTALYVLENVPAEKMVQQEWHCWNVTSTTILTQLSHKVYRSLGLYKRLIKNVKHVLLLFLLM